MCLEMFIVARDISFSRLLLSVVVCCYVIFSFSVDGVKHVELYQSLLENYVSEQIPVYDYHTVVEIRTAFDIYQLLDMVRCHSF